MSQLIGGAGGLGWVAAKAVLMFAVAVVGLRLGELYETRGATTLVGADADPGPLTRNALSAAGFSDVTSSRRRAVHDHERFSHLYAYVPSSGLNAS